MLLQFYKYQGTGNDFVVLDNREQIFPKDDVSLIKKLCHRKFGIGSDGLILVENHTHLDFTMVFYNPDGSQSFCGNGSRCAVHFAHHLGLIKDKTSFLSTDGQHEAVISNELIELKMQDVSKVVEGENYHFIHTGSPHHMVFTDDVNEVDVILKGREIRNREKYSPGGTNVNFVEENSNGIKIRTYERGVENETLSCGTGVTASALSWAYRKKKEKGELAVETMGGDLKVKFRKTARGFEDIWLIGPAEMVFKGEIEC